MEESTIWTSAVETVQTSQSSFFKFVTANDSGETGGHQSGFHIPKSAAPVLFRREFHKGEFYEEDINITWRMVWSHVVQLSITARRHGTNTD